MKQDKILIILAILILIVLAVQEITLLSITSNLAVQQLALQDIASKIGERGIPRTNAPTNAELIPKGRPSYGEELNLSFDDVENSIIILARYDGTTKLEGENLQKYVRIASRTACEYCCGARTLVFADGSPACACAHSSAMRGVAKYLVLNHGDMSDDEILLEVNKWKAAFFPGETIKKAQATNTSVPASVGEC